MFRVTFKTPDAVGEAVEEELRDVTDEEERAWRRDAIEALVKRYVAFGECVTLEFDAADGTVRVVPVRG